MNAACSAGVRYFVYVFTLAFALGVARVFVIAPWLGTITAVAFEVPILIAASWFFARRLLRVRSFVLSQRAIMGATAFSLTMASEAGLVLIIGGQSVTDWAMTLVTPIGLVGLTGQIIFGLMPISLGQNSPAERHG
jgi:hypothetical protein